MAYIRKLASGRWQCQVRLTGLKPISRTFKTRALARTFGRKVEGDAELARKLGAPTTQCPQIGELLTEYLAAIDLRDPNFGQRLGWWKDQFGADTKVIDIDEHDVDDGLQALAKRKGRGGRLMSGSLINRYKWCYRRCHGPAVDRSMQVLSSRMGHIEFDPQWPVVGQIVGAPLPEAAKTCLLVAVWSAYAGAAGLRMTVRGGPRVGAEILIAHGIVERAKDTARASTGGQRH